uniref:Uncharacterized protein n=1 Tax=Oryza sativa subsp. japonica TaxID=39947 RepID=Q2QV95_ORYSJ|nr:hypothetical protein LOC_Os12g13580 [Oryza sativa Japonica Group]
MAIVDNENLLSQNMRGYSLDKNKRGLRNSVRLSTCTGRRQSSFWERDCSASVLHGIVFFLYIDSLLCFVYFHYFNISIGGGAGGGGGKDTGEGENVNINGGNNTNNASSSTKAFSGTPFQLVTILFFKQRSPLACPVPMEDLDFQRNSKLPNELYVIVVTYNKGEWRIGRVYDPL